MQLTAKEQEQIKKWAGHDKMKGSKIINMLNKNREGRGDTPVEKSTVYRFLRGETHVRGAPETRGRPNILTRQDIRKLQQARRRLIRNADSEERVTWQDVLDEADLDSAPSLRLVEETLRNEAVRFRPPRKKIALKSEDAKKRYRVAVEWKKKRKSYWLGMHGYYDNKNFPLPLKPAQVAKLKQTRITGHLRTPAEGVEKGFTKPRTEHAWIGFPSVTISAVVARNRVIMWEVVEGSWNGAKAASIYAGPMLKALQRVWGPKRSYSIVEDGDRKGNQSNKGKRAKAAAEIKAITLPPRSPCWMPLDFSIWDRILDDVLENAPGYVETKPEFLRRLRKCAMSLPRGWVAKQIGRMKEQIEGVVDAKGYHPKTD